MVEFKLYKGYISQSVLWIPQELIFSIKLSLFTIVANSFDLSQLQHSLCIVHRSVETLEYVVKFEYRAAFHGRGTLSRNYLQMCSNFLSSRVVCQACTFVPPIPPSPPSLHLGLDLDLWSFFMLWLNLANEKSHFTSDRYCYCLTYQVWNSEPMRISLRTIFRTRSLLYHSPYTKTVYLICPQLTYTYPHTAKNGPCFEKCSNVNR